MWTSSFEIASRRHDARCGALRRRHARIAVQVPLPGRRFAQLPVPDGTGVVRERRVLTPRAERLERFECVDRQDTFGDRIPNRVSESGQMLRLAREARHRVRVPDQDDQLEGLLAQLPGGVQAATARSRAGRTRRWCSKSSCRSRTSAHPCAARVPSASTPAAMQAAASSVTVSARRADRCDARRCGPARRAGTRRDRYR